MAKERQTNEAAPPKRQVPLDQTREVVMEVLLEQLRIRGTGTVELVHQLCTFERDAGPLIGGAVNALQQAGRIRRVDMQHARRQQAHGRFLSVWELTG